MITLVGSPSFARAARRRRDRDLAGRSHLTAIARTCTLWCDEPRTWIPFLGIRLTTLFAADHDSRGRGKEVQK